MAVTIDQIPQAALDMIPGAACVAFTLCTPDGTVVGHGFKIRGGNEGVFIPVNPSADPDPGTLDFTWPGAAAYMLLLFEDF